MEPRFGLSRAFYNIKRGFNWPNYDDFLNMDLEDIDSEDIRDEIQNLINFEPKYHKSLWPLLRHQFQGSENITEHYSQSWQDLFVLTMLDGKRNGTYLEIGCGNPIYINNTYLLEQFDYAGISIDIELNNEWKSLRSKNKYIVADAKQIDYTEILRDMPKQIDYLQLDIDPEQATLEVLKKLPHSSHRFSVITYETDSFKGDMETRNTSREFLKSLGYEMIVNDVGVKQYSDSSWVPFEDWYVDPNVISKNIIDCFKGTKQFKINFAHQLFLKD